MTNDRCEQKLTGKCTLQILKISDGPASPDEQARPLVACNSVLLWLKRVCAFRHDTSPWSPALSNPLGKHRLNFRAWPLILHPTRP